MVSEIETEPTFSPGTPTEVFPTAGLALGGRGRLYDPAPDGERFVVRRAAQSTGADAFDGLIVVEHWLEELKERVPVP